METWKGACACVLWGLCAHFEILRVLKTQTPSLFDGSYGVVRDRLRDDMCGGLITQQRSSKVGRGGERPTARLFASLFGFIRSAVSESWRCSDPSRLAAHERHVSMSNILHGLVCQLELSPQESSSPYMEK